MPKRNTAAEDGLTDTRSCAQSDPELLGAKNPITANELGKEDLNMNKKIESVSGSNEDVSSDALTPDEVGRRLYDYLLMKASFCEATMFLENRGIGAREIAIACDVMNGSLVTRFMGLGQCIADNVVAGAELDSLGAKWHLSESEIEKFAESLVADPEVARAVNDLVMWFWVGEPCFRLWLYKGVEAART